jgi:hypothetical protein
VLQGCHSPHCVSLARRALQDALRAPRVPLASFIFLARRALQDALRAPRVPLASFHFSCTTFPSGCTMCSKGATCLLTDLVDIKNPGVNTPSGDLVGD